jgi:hypothetical protein
MIIAKAQNLLNSQTHETGSVQQWFHAWLWKKQGNLVVVAFIASMFC